MTKDRIVAALVIVAVTVGLILVLTNHDSQDFDHGNAAPPPSVGHLHAPDPSSDH